MKQTKNNLTKIVIISDSHNLNKLVTETIKKEKADINICVGDLEQFNDPDKILSDEVRDKIFDHWVYGNHEVTIRMMRNVLDGKWWWNNMKNAYKTFMLGNKKVLLVHFFEDEARLIKTISKQTGKLIDIATWKDRLVKKTKPDIVICGHTHVPTIEVNTDYKIGDKIYKFDIINPGTLNIEKNRSTKHNYASYVIGYLNKKTNEIKWKLAKV